MHKSGMRKMEVRRGRQTPRNQESFYKLSPQQLKTPSPKQAFKAGGAWQATVHGSQRVRQDSVTEQHKNKYFLILYINLNSKRVEDLNVRPETLKQLEGNIGCILLDMIHSIYFWICLLVK